jgi:hypothetical protein
VHCALFNHGRQLEYFIFKTPPHPLLDSRACGSSYVGGGVDAVAAAATDDDDDD